MAMAGSAFAATLILISGFFHVLMGVEAIVRSAFFLRATSYLFRLNFTAWGWIHLTLGVLLVVCAIFLYARAPWAVMVGLVLAVLSIVDNFLFLPFYPVWSLLNIAVGIFVIWALAATMGATSGVHRAAPAEETTRWPPANPPGGTTADRSARAAHDAPAAPSPPPTRETAATEPAEAKPAATPPAERPESTPPGEVPD
jgi:hypothetical protein